VATAATEVFWLCAIDVAVAREASVDVGPTDLVVYVEGLGTVGAVLPGRVVQAVAHAAVAVLAGLGPQVRTRIVLARFGVAVAFARETRVAGAAGLEEVGVQPGLAVEQRLALPAVRTGRVVLTFACQVGCLGRNICLGCLRARPAACRSVA